MQDPETNQEKPEAKLIRSKQAPDIPTIEDLTQSRDYEELMRFDIRLNDEVARRKRATLDQANTEAAHPRENAFKAEVLEITDLLYRKLFQMAVKTLSDGTAKQGWLFGRNKYRAVIDMPEIPEKDCPYKLVLAFNRNKAGTLMIDRFRVAPKVNNWGYSGWGERHERQDEDSALLVVACEGGYVKSIKSNLIEFDKIPRIKNLFPEFIYTGKDDEKRQAWIAQRVDPSPEPKNVGFTRWLTLDGLDTSPQATLLFYQQNVGHFRNAELKLSPEEYTDILTRTFQLIPSSPLPLDALPTSKV